MARAPDRRHTRGPEAIVAVSVLDLVEETGQRLAEVVRVVALHGVAGALDRDQAPMRQGPRQPLPGRGVEDVALDTVDHERGAGHARRGLPQLPRAEDLFNVAPGLDEVRVPL